MRITVRSFRPLSLNVVDLDSHRSSDYDSKPIARNRRKQDFLLIIGSFSNFVSNQLFVEPYRKIFYFFLFLFFFFKMLTAFSVSVKKISLVELI